MEESTDYTLKVDGEFHQFDGGATRYTKTGKGRFDLIPGTVMSKIIDYYKKFVENFAAFDKLDCLKTAISEEYSIEVRFAKAICMITLLSYCLSYDEFDKGIASMLKDLAVHFEKGAEKYGERNCEKGIPLKSFIDSGLRHLTQWIYGDTDEPHHISAIWNFVMAIWTIENHPDEMEIK